MDDINTVIECIKESKKKSLLMSNDELKLLGDFSNIFVSSLEDEDATDTSNHLL